MSNSKPRGVLRVRSTGSTTAPREAHAAPDGPAAGGRPNAKAARHALDRMAESADRLTAALTETPRDLRTEILGKR
jgi:hypothetical protein